MKIYKNGDRCPCCGAQLSGFSDDTLAVFSQLCNVANLCELEMPTWEKQEIDTNFPRPSIGINPPIKPKR